jgi:Spy/CpxP family protein refolding chaperone
MRRVPPVAVIAFVASVTTFALALPTVALAKVGQEFQAQPQNPPPQGGGPLPGLDNGDMTPGEIQKLFDAYLIMEAQQALQLSDQQYPQFLTRLRTLQDVRRRTQQERNQLMGQLQRLTNPRQPKPADESEIKARLTSLQELESRTAAEMRKAYNALDEVLDVRQQGRFRVFEEQIERRKIELLMRSRQQNRLNNARPNQAPPKRPPPLD